MNMKKYCEKLQSKKTGLIGLDKVRNNQNNP